MSNDKLTGTSSVNSKAHQQAEVVKQGSALDTLLWIVALGLLLVSLVANTYLPKYWVAANDIWVRVGVISACVVIAVVLLYLTTQGKNFIQLLKESRIELRRVVWPTKSETINTSWQVMLVVAITAFLLWCFDTFFNWLMTIVIG